MRRTLLTLSLALAGCVPDYPPPDALLISRLTLFDATSRDRMIFTDTTAPLDCADPAFAAKEACTVNPFKDRFSLKKSAPTPDSGAQMRVIFNKLAVRLRGQDLQQLDSPADPPPLRDPGVLKLQCTSACTAVPPTVTEARLAGSDQSPDPINFPYGPALQIAVSATTASPLAALEPETSYKIVVDPGLAGHNDVPVTLDAMTLQILQFTTEPFQVLRVGTGDATADAWVYAEPKDRYEITKVPQDGALALRLNASLDGAALPMDAVTATVDGMAVPVRWTFARVAADKKCGTGQQRTLYLAPAMGTAWPAGSKLEVRVKAGSLRDVSQEAGHPAMKGRHSLSRELILAATLSGQSADMNYQGARISDVPPGCP